MHYCFHVLHAYNPDSICGLAGLEYLLMIQSWIRNVDSDILHIISGAYGFLHVIMARPIIISSHVKPSISRVAMKSLIMSFKHGQRLFI